MSALRRRLSPVLVGRALVVVGLAALAVWVVVNLPRHVDAAGALDECQDGWPVVLFDGQDWRQSLPDDLRATAPRAMPVAAWPGGLFYDEHVGAVVDRTGIVVIRKGTRVQVTGTIVRTSGDPAPCFITLGIQLDSIGAAPSAR